MINVTEHIIDFYIFYPMLPGFPGLLCSPLHAAALHCDTAVLTALIEAKADINAKAEVPAVPGFSHSWTLNICMTYVC